MHWKIFGLIFFLVLTLFACEREPCKDFVCLNGIPLPDGKDCICLCDFGWDGKDCSVEDKCKTNKVGCVAGHGTCNSNTGLCQCLPGFEGDSCQIISRDRFLNSGDSTTWSANDTCLPNEPVKYTITIAQATFDGVTLNVFNLMDLGQAEWLSVRVIDYTFKQRVSDITLNGVIINDLEGNLSQDRRLINVTYSTDEANFNCSGVWIRN